MIDEELTHHPRSEREKVRAIFDAEVVRPNHAKVRLVNQRGGLQGVLSGLIAKVMLRETAELGVHESEERIDRALVPVSDLP